MYEELKQAVKASAGIYHPKIQRAFLPGMFVKYLNELIEMHTNGYVSTEHTKKGLQKGNEYFQRSILRHTIRMAKYFIDHHTDPLQGPICHCHASKNGAYLRMLSEIYTPEVFRAFLDYANEGWTLHYTHTHNAGSNPYAAKCSGTLGYAPCQDFKDFYERFPYFDHEYCKENNYDSDTVAEQLHFAANAVGYEYLIPAYSFDVFNQTPSYKNKRVELGRTTYVLRELPQELIDAYILYGAYVTAAHIQVMGTVPELQAERVTGAEGIESLKSEARDFIERLQKYIRENAKDLSLDAPPLLRAPGLLYTPGNGNVDKFGAERTHCF